MNITLNRTNLPASDLKKTMFTSNISDIIKYDISVTTKLIYCVYTRKVET